MITNIDMELYRIFFVTAKTGSISKAAEKLFVSQPAVSQSIKHLEESLGSQLFIRKPRGVVMTENAAELYKELENAFYIFQAAERNFLSRANNTEGELRVNATEILIRYALLPYLNEFSKKFPNVKIKLSSKGTPDALKDIKSGKTHIALATLPASSSSSLKIMPLFTFHDCFVAGKDYEFLTKTRKSLRDLMRYPVLVLREGMNSRQYLEKLCKIYGYSLEPYLEAESIDTLIQCALYNCGISFIIREFAERDIAENKLFEIPVEEIIEPRHIGIVTLDSAMPDYALHFIKGLKETF